VDRQGGSSTVAPFYNAESSNIKESKCKPNSSNTKQFS